MALRNFLCFLSATLAGALIPEASYSFENFVQDFQRNYRQGTQEYETRKQIFEARLREIQAHNADTTKTWKRGVNELADVSPSEFAASGRLGYNKALANELVAKAGLASAKRAPVVNQSALASLPKSLDWREKGVVSQVKDQGHCGSCWAFATTANIESHVAIATGTLESLSPQQLVSCAPNPLKCGGVGGCQGSVAEIGYNYVQLYGMTTEWMMPYTSYFGENPSCRMNSTKTPAVIEISGYQKLPANDYNAVMQALVHVGPLAINVDASTWHDYESGVFDGCAGKTDIDHVVQLVGYGTDPSKGDYWLVRNSWDAVWGEQGYIRLARRATPECGEDLSPADGTGCQGGPVTQHVCGTCGLLFDASYPLGARVVKYGHHLFV